MNAIEVFKNLLIVVPGVRKLASRSYRTGIMNDPLIVKKRFSEMAQLIEKGGYKNASVLEIGPGQTSNVILNLQKSKHVTKAYVSDITDYFGSEYWENNEIKFCKGSIDTINAQSIDLIYSYDVLEHIHDPKKFLLGIKRVMHQNSLLFFDWDLRDHLKLGVEENWFDMHKYTNLAWYMQMSNRTSFVNRLQMNDWKDLFMRAGFQILTVETLESEVASAEMKKKHNINVDAVYRAKAILALKAKI